MKLHLLRLPLRTNKFINFVVEGWIFIALHIYLARNGLIIQFDGHNKNWQFVAKRKKQTTRCN